MCYFLRFNWIICIKTVFFSPYTHNSVLQQQHISLHFIYNQFLIVVQHVLSKWCARHNTIQFRNFGSQLPSIAFLFGYRFSNHWFCRDNWDGSMWGLMGRYRRSKVKERLPSHTSFGLSNNAVKADRQTQSVLSSFTINYPFKDSQNLLSTWVKTAAFEDSDLSMYSKVINCLTRSAEVKPIVWTFLSHSLKFSFF